MCIRDRIYKEEEEEEMIIERYAIDKLNSSLAMIPLEKCEEVLYSDAYANADRANYFVCLLIIFLPLLCILMLTYAMKRKS